MHAINHISAYYEHGPHSAFAVFNPPTSTINYQEPNIYSIMPDTVAELVMETVRQELKDADCFRLQIVGSVDKYSVNKSITANYFNLVKGRDTTKNFLGPHHSDKNGAEVLDAVLINLTNWYWGNFRTEVD